MEPEDTAYLSIILKLIAKFDLKPFGEELAALGLLGSGNGLFPDGAWWGFRQPIHMADFVVLAGDLPRGQGRPEREAIALLNILEPMPPEMRNTWNRCLSRRFDFGYQAGILPYIHRNRVSPRTLRRMAALKIEHEVTIYGCDPGLLNTTSGAATGS